MKPSNLLILFSFTFIFLLLFHSPLQALTETENQYSSSVLKDKSWQALQYNKYDDVIKYTDQCLKLYKEEAQSQQASLTEFPWASIEEIKKYTVLNDVGQCLLARGMALAKLNKPDEAQNYFNEIIEKFYFSQSTDDCFAWKIAEAAQHYLAEIEEPLQKQNREQIKEEWNKPAQPIALLNIPNAFTGIFYWYTHPHQPGRVKLVIDRVEDPTERILKFEGKHFYDDGQYIINIRGEIDLSNQKIKIWELGPSTSGFVTDGVFEGKIHPSFEYIKAHWTPDDANEATGDLQLFALTPNGENLRTNLLTPASERCYTPLEITRISLSGKGVVGLKNRSADEALGLAQKKALAEIIDKVISQHLEGEQRSGYDTDQNLRAIILSGPFPFLSRVEVWMREVRSKSVEVRLSATCDINGLKDYIKIKSSQQETTLKKENSTNLLSAPNLDQDKDYLGQTESAYNPFKAVYTPPFHCGVFAPNFDFRSIQCMNPEECSEKMIERLSQIIDKDENNHLAFLHRGIAYFGYDELDLALADLNQTIALEPHNPYAYFNRALVYLTLHEYEKALTDFNLTLSKSPRIGYLLYPFRAIAYYHLDQHEKCLKDWEMLDSKQARFPHGCGSVKKEYEGLIKSLEKKGGE